MKLGLHNLRVVGASPMRETLRSRLVTRLLERIRGSFDLSHIVPTFTEATNGDFFLVGGSVRRAFLDDRDSGDFDIMIPNGDARAFNALDALQVPYVLNSHGHRRYRWNNTQIDMFHPTEFFHGFSDVTSALRFFDVRINSLGFHFRTHQVIDPFKILESDFSGDPGINWPRWNQMDSYHTSVLSIRLAKLIKEHPAFVIPPGDNDRLLKTIIPILIGADWKKVNWRFPLGKDAFISEFASILKSKKSRETFRKSSGLSVGQA